MLALSLFPSRPVRVYHISSSLVLSLMEMLSKEKSLQLYQVKNVFMFNVYGDENENTYINKKLDLMSMFYYTMKYKSDFLLLWHLKYRFIHHVCIFVENDRNIPKPQQYYSNFLFKWNI